jgi:phosphopantothenoylcysteine decarboxylase/phosphopantothenate--cysteine ligase
LVTGPTHQQTFYKGIQVKHVVSAEQMFEEAVAVFSSCDIAVMSAAVADFKPGTVMTEKIKKAGATPTLALVRTNDILKHLGGTKKDGQFLVGFALETQHEKENALEKLRTKNSDCIVLNSLRDEKAGFGIDTNKVTILNKDATEVSLGPDSKKNIAKEIVSFIVSQIHV